MEWIELKEDSLPSPNILCWVERKGGAIYLASRPDKPLSTNEDPSKDCYWFGNPFPTYILTEKNGDLPATCHFSDVTVMRYMPVKSPKI